jgi:hypothetical protein
MLLPFGIQNANKECTEFYTSSPSVFMAWCLIEQRKNFAFSVQFTLTLEDLFHAG